MKDFALLFTFLFAFIACNNDKKEEFNPEFKTHFDAYQVKGCFLLYDFQKNSTLIYNKERGSQAFLPASTFKMVNTLIGLETQIIPDRNFVIPWDSVSRQVPVWNKDHQLISAFQNSVVPWYQELARRIGVNQMNYWVSKSSFGEMDITNENLDLFWLTGKSSITPYQQLDFQKRLILNQLPFQKENIEILKEIMVMDETSEYILRGKTGWAVMNNKNIGWLVGYLEKGNKKYAYVLNVESENEDSSWFQKSRTEIVRRIFKELSLI